MKFIGLILIFLISCPAWATNFDSLDDYEVLGLSPEASNFEVELRFKSLLKKWHPDKVTDPVTKKQHHIIMGQINAARSRINEGNPRRIKGWKPDPNIVKDYDKDLVERLKKETNIISSNSKPAVSSVKAAALAIEKLEDEILLVAGGEKRISTLSQFVADMTPQFKISNSANVADFEDLYRKLKRHKAGDYYYKIGKTLKKFASEKSYNIVRSYIILEDAYNKASSLGYDPLTSLAIASKEHFGDVDDPQLTREFGSKSHAAGYKKFLKDKIQLLESNVAISKSTSSQLLEALYYSNAYEEFYEVILLNKNSNHTIDGLVLAALRTKVGDIPKFHKVLDEVYGEKLGSKLIEFLEDSLKTSENDYLKSRIRNILEIAGRSDFPEKTEILKIISKSKNVPKEARRMASVYSREGCNSFVSAFKRALDILLIR